MIIKNKEIEMLHVLFGGSGPGKDTQDTPKPKEENKSEESPKPDKKPTTKSGGAGKGKINW